MKDKIHEIEILSEKRHINEKCLSKWLQLEMKQIHLASYFYRRGIMKLCLYGYGVLGQHVVKALEDSPVEILCVIDKNVNLENVDLPVHRSAAGMEGNYILISVMSDVWMITNDLKMHGCKHIIELEHVLNMLEREETDKKMGINSAFYPELMKYQNIEFVKDLQFANFGTGLGYYAFCYEGLPIKAFNFSLPQQNLEFDYKLMRNYQDKILPGGIICLVLPYCIFLADHVLEIDEVNERYYSILPRAEVESRCNTVFEAYEARQNDMGRQWENESSVLELREIHERRMQECQVEDVLNAWKNQLGIFSFEEGLQRLEWDREIAASKSWLEKILTLCKEKAWQLVIIVPPMSQFLLDRISLKFREVNFYSILHDVIKEEIPILDYSESEEFCNPDLYGTPCFLAKKGAKCFTQDVLNRLGIL